MGMTRAPILVERKERQAVPAFFQKLNKVKPIYDWTYKVIMLICKLLLIADIIITTWVVLGRYISFIPNPHWSEEIILTFMVYMAVLSATLAIRNKAHIRMTAFDKYLPKKLLLSMDVLADVAVLVLGVILLVEGINVCNSPLAKFAKYSSIPTLSMVWQYLSIPVAGAGMIIFELEQIILHIEEFFIKEETDKEGLTKKEVHG